MDALASHLTLQMAAGEGAIAPFLGSFLALFLLLQAICALTLRRLQSVEGVVRIAALSTLAGGGIGALVAGFGWESAPAIRLSLSGFESPHAVSIGFSLDRLAGLMVALVGFLGWIVLRFSAIYLRSEKARAKFLQVLLGTTLLVQLFALSTSLLGHAVVWLLLSTCVHFLLRHYEERPRARLAAKKKFLISRAADVILWGALVLFFREFGTWDLTELTQKSEASFAGQAAVVGLCLAVLMKSAQFPLHSWLPETMDAPTPVSAIMHAGVVNAGAFLLLRAAGLLELSSVALALLVFVGGVTAAFGTFVGSVQTSVKLRLAYSTVAQMGFLFFELGLGLTGAAVLHLIAHALYKAHAFLRSGSPQRPVEPSQLGPLPLVGVVSGSVLAFGLALAGSSLLLGKDLSSYAPLGIVWALGTSQYLLGPVSVPAASRVRNYVFVGLGVWGLGLFAETYLATWFPSLPGFLEGGVTTMVAVTLALSLVLLAFLLSTGGQFRGAGTRSLCVHALSGFYFGELTDRLTQKLWPDSTGASSSSSSSFQKALS